MQGRGYKLQLTSKRLKSGRCQIKFTVLAAHESRSCYGYILADAGSTLRQVVEQIETRLKDRDNPEMFYHSHLYNLQQRATKNDQFLLYEAS